MLESAVLMAFNVSNFRAGINQYKFDGLAQSNKFHMIMDVPRIVAPYAPAVVNREVQFFCDTISLPGKNLTTMDYKKQGYGEITKMPMGRAAENITTTFFCDSKYLMMKLFQGWLDYIVEGTDAAPSQILTNGRKYREVAYREDYVTTVIVRTYNDSGDAGDDIFNSGIRNPLMPGIGMEYKFYNCHPVQLGAVSMGWEQNDTILKLPVEFTFTHYETKLLGSINPRSLDPSNVGLIDRILQIKDLAGTILNTKRPRNIQDAIDLATNTTGIFKQL